MEKVSTTRRLVESAMLIAIASVLSVLQIVHLPYGGSITVSSMLPILIIAYRYGTPWGMFTGFVYGLIQLALGSHNLSYVTGAASVIALILLDYLLAFTVIGLGGLVRKSSSQVYSLVIGSLIAAVLRYIMHVISGCTVWAGLSIPTTEALRYSLVYNATYMIPETLILMVVSYLLGTTLDFNKKNLGFIAKQDQTPLQHTLAAIANALIAVAAVFDIASIFKVLQNPDSGELDITAISTAPWGAIIIVTAICCVAAAALLLFSKRIGKEKEA